jgi:hypothetical protein
MQMSAISLMAPGNSNDIYRRSWLLQTYVQLACELFTATELQAALLP